MLCRHQYLVIVVDTPYSLLDVSRSLLQLLDLLLRCWKSLHRSLRSHESGHLRNLIVESVLSLPDLLLLRVPVLLKPWSRLILGNIDGRRHLLFSGSVTVGSLTVIRTSVSTDLNLNKDEINLKLVTMNEINNYLATNVDSH